MIVTTRQFYQLAFKKFAAGGTNNLIKPITTGN
jgi:hypothetical protein